MQGGRSMCQQVDERFEVRETTSGGAVIVSLDANNSIIAAGGHDRDGSLVLRNRNDRPTILMNQSGDRPQPLGPGLVSAIRQGQHLDYGSIIVGNQNGETRIELNGEMATIELGAQNGATIVLNGNEGRMGIGAEDPEARLHVHGGGNNEWGMILSSPGGSARGLKISTAWYGHDDIPLLEVGALDGTREVHRFVVNANGDGFFYRADGSPSIHLDGNEGQVGIGTKDPEARLHVHGGDNNKWGMILSSPGGSAHGLKISTAYHGHADIPLLQAGAHNRAGDEVRRFVVNANGDGFFYRADGSPSIHLDGEAGDIKLLGADCAEDFDVLATDAVEPGSVMIIDQDGILQPCADAYDKRVAGVISGAGDLKPGLVLNRKEERSDRMPIALVGKVNCKVDATRAPIEVGDLLTTSSMRGHAMKVAEPLRAFGAVLGKALRPLSEGTGVIPILVTLQ
jgi:hypothetical protein